jgi:uncharacterized protein
MPAFAVRTLAAASQIQPADWARLGSPGHPFLNGEFFGILEKHGTAGPANGWRAQHWVVEGADGAVVGILPTYLKAHSHGDFVRDWQWASAYQQLGKVYYPKLLSGFPHTPASGPRLLADEGEAGDKVRVQLIESVKSWVTEHHLSSWHVALPHSREVDLLLAQGLLVSHDVQFQWRNRGYGDFDGYLGTFPSAKRRKVKAERRRVAESGLVLETRHGNEIDPGEWPALYELYASTFDKYGNHAAFTPGCFAELACILGRRMVLFIAREQGAPVALSICFRSDDTLYGRYWGSSGNYHSLHFELCFYQGIAYCLQEGLTTFEPGAGGEHKVARGFEPTVVNSCHWIADARMRQLIGDYLERQAAHIMAYADEAASHLPFELPVEA